MGHLKKFFSVSVLAFCASSMALAFDVDGHFYGTYAMARYVGIRHEVAAKIAAAAQWMDESYISDPTSMIVLPISGVKKRRLLHFPSSRIGGQVSAGVQQAMLGMDEMSDVQEWILKKLSEKTGVTTNVSELNFITETDPGHPFASEMFMEGLKEGNLMKCGGGLHTLEDSFAHAGTPAGQGHAAFWHWPDRPSSSPEKYMQMVPAVMTALVAIRAQLPREAIDEDLSLGFADGSKNFELGAKTLAAHYLAIPNVARAVVYDALRDPEYVVTAMDHFYERAKKAQYLKIDKQQFDLILAEIRKDHPGERLDTYQTMEEFIKRVIRAQILAKADILDVRYVLDDLGYLPKESSIDVRQYLDSFGEESFFSKGLDPSVSSEAFDNFVTKVSDDVLRWHVPYVLSDTHRMEIEDDKGPVRKKEMEIRISVMQQMIVDLFGDKVEFLENPTKDQQGFGKEMRKDPAAEAKLPKPDGTRYVTFNLREKHAWNRMIFKYLYPTLEPGDLDKMVAFVHKVNEVKAAVTNFLPERDRIYAQADKWQFTKVREAAAHDAATIKKLASVPSLLDELGPFGPKLLKDLLTTHATASPDVFFYKNRDLFMQYRKEGKIKPLLGSTDVWSWVQLKQESDRIRGLAQN